MKRKEFTCEQERNEYIDTLGAIIYRYEMSSEKSLLIAFVDYRKVQLYVMQENAITYVSTQVIKTEEYSVFIRNKYVTYRGEKIYLRECKEYVSAIEERYAR